MYFATTTSAVIWIWIFRYFWALTTFSNTFHRIFLLLRRGYNPTRQQCQQMCVLHMCMFSCTWHLFSYFGEFMTPVQFLANPQPMFYTKTSWVCLCYSFLNDVRCYIWPFLSYFSLWICYEIQPAVGTPYTAVQNVWTISLARNDQFESGFRLKRLAIYMKTTHK